jgi:radical SAM superfamily enzyme YgiQ (UPF0313 family)
MRQPGSILLISCYELGHPPHGVASPLGFLERAGFAPDAIDVARASLDPAKIERARLIGISVPMHTALRLGLRVADRIRALNPSCHLCFYGLYAHLNADLLLRGRADSILGGEYEEALVALARALEEGADPASLPGVTVAGRPAPPILQRLRFAPPSRKSLPPLASYAALEAGEERLAAGYTEASRGCLHRCRHCPIPPVYGGRFFVVPRGIVLEDVRSQVSAGARHVTFGDPDFLNGPAHSLAILREMRREFPFVSHDFTAKIEHLLKHRDLLPEMASLGCSFIVSAVESLSDRVLGILEKGHTRSDVLEAFRIVRAAGITLRPSLLPFTPWSTLEDYGELLDFLEAEDLIEAVDPVQLAVRLLIPSRSLLLAHPAMLPYLDDAAEAKSLSRAWTHPDRRMDVLHREVTSLVEKAAHEKEDPRLTFRRIGRCFRAAAGAPSPEDSGDLLALSTPFPKRHLPRLTESWFC